MWSYMFTFYTFIYNEERADSDGSVIAILFRRLFVTRIVWSVAILTSFIRIGDSH